jgi:HprK-related kinase A
MPWQFQGSTRDLQIGPFTVRVRAESAALRRAIETMYSDFPNKPPNGFADFHIAVDRVGGPQKWIRRRVIFEHEGISPFRSMKLSEALLLFEGGLNWAIGQNANFFLVIHAAAVERDGRAAIIPGFSGTGKSTLCAALINGGWRLLSDELGLIALDNGRVAALARPISLKNDAIEAVARFAPESVFSSPISGTEKGTVAFLKPPADSVHRMEESALPEWIIIPRYVPGEQPLLVPLGKAETFRTLHDSTYNEHLMGRTGFELLANLVDQSQCYQFTYSALADAVDAFARLIPTAVMSDSSCPDLIRASARNWHDPTISPRRPGQARP